MKKQPETKVQEELKELAAPRLQALKDMNRGLQPPENYFQTMQQEVLSKIGESASPKPSKVRSLNPFLRVAAVLLLAALTYWMLRPLASSPAVEQPLASFTDIETYVLENAELFDLETILKVQGAYAETEQLLPNDLSDDELDQFFEENLDEFDLATLESYF